MSPQITKGVSVSIETYYQPKHSQPQKKEYAFSYKVVIENKSEHTVKLLRRHWQIFDARGEQREVEGEGVVGKQPVIAPNERHEYISSCLLNSTIGKMDGTFLMERTDNGEQFQVKVPVFNLIAPPRKN